MVTAQAQGRPIEDLAARTIDSSTWALPNGQWHVGVGAGPVWVPQPTGGDGSAVEDWARVDLTLVVGEDGLVRPRAQLAGLVLAGGPAAPVPAAGEGAGGEGVVLASLTDPVSGQVMTTGWGGGELPVPVLQGRRAVYADVLEGVDLVVEATNTGFEEFFVLANADAGAALAQVDMGVGTSDGGTIETTASGELLLTGADESVVATSGVPLMWDATSDAAMDFPLAVERPAEEPGGVFPETVSDWATFGTEDTADEPADQGGTRTPVTDALDADPLSAAVEVARTAEVDGQSATVTLAPDEDFLGDPATQFPVVVDPSISLSVGFDTYVQTGNTSDYSGATEVRVGTYDSGAHVARSFLNFNTASLAGRVVSAASLSMYSFHSNSCTATGWEAWLTGGVSTATRWTAQPTWLARHGTSTATAGFSSSCPAARTAITLTGAMVYAAEHSTGVTTIGLRAVSETSNSGWKRFYSADNGSNVPVLSVTYNSYPHVPTGRSHAGGQSTYYPSATDPNRVLYVNTARPTLRSVVSDPDGGQVRALYTVTTGSTTVWNQLAGPYVASGGYSNFVPTTATPALTNGQTYTVVVRAHDGALTRASDSSWTFVVDTAKPATPTIGANNLTSGAWVETTPASNTFTFTTTSTDTVRFEYSRDGTAWTSVAATGTGSTRTATLSWVAPGAHTLVVRAIDRAGNISATSTMFTFGTGAAAMTSPTSGAKSTDTFRITAGAPSAGSGTVTPTIYWRPAGTANAAGWNPAVGSTSGWTAATTLPAVGAGTAVNVNTLFSAAAAATTMGSARTPALIDVQVCFAYSATSVTRCTWTTNTDGHASHVSVLRVPHAFGDSFPEAEAGPGRVALWTGEFTTTATDVSITTPADTLSISRTYATYAGPANTANSVFGPGWVANLDGSDWGGAGYEVADSTGIDGTLALIDGDGAAFVWRQPGGTNTWHKPGTYTAVDEDTQALGARLERTGTGASAQLVLTEEDGTVTTWTPQTYTASAAITWLPVSVAQAGAVGTTVFTRDATGRITRILAPTPDGVTCPANGTLNPGCRALRLVYATATTATAGTPGDYLGRLTAVFYDAYNPDKTGGAGMDSIQVATYAYTPAGWLATATDPRTSLTTSYTYNPIPTGLVAPQLATFTEPGLAPWSFTYATTSQGTHGLTQVLRAPATGTGAPLPQASFVYGINPTTATTGLPDMSAAGVGVWEQQTAPTWGAAVFGPDHPVTTHNPTAITAADWPYADLLYTDAKGYTLNTAAHGAGNWQLTATDYDTGGRVIRTLDQRAIDQIRTLVGAGQTVDVNSYATITRYNPEITATSAITHNSGTIAVGTVLTPAGTLVTDTWAPAAPAGTDGALVRVHTHTDYDQGAPNQGVNPTTGVPYRLPTTVTTTSAAPDTGSSSPETPVATGEPVLSESLTGYDPIDGTSTTGTTSGWTLAMATTTTTVMGSGQPDIVARTAYDSAGHAIQVRQPASTGTDAGTTLTVYYTTAANSTDPGCGNQPAYAGLLCLIRTAETTPTIATVHTTSYNLYGQPRTITETLGATTRTTTTTTDTAGRTLTAQIATTGLTGSTPLPITKTEYSPTTGLATATVSLNGVTETGRISTGYDNWGRTVTYTDTDNATSTTTYNPAGQIATATDPTGTLTYTYDGTDAHGNTEHRGLPTAMVVTNTGGNLAFGAGYDAGGELTLQTLPGNIHQVHTFDRAGQLTELTYTGNGPTERFNWFNFTQTHDADGDIIGDTAAGRTRTFSNDRADRLTTVEDTINDGTAETCTTRTYSFDPNGNRTTANTTTAAPDAPCTTTEATSRAWTHDSADRVQTGANTTGTYTYDNLGRQTTIPGIDTPAGTAAGDLTIGYYDGDLVRTTTQNGTITTYTLDPAGRRSTAIAGNGTNQTNVQRHYTDTSDNPAWATLTFLTNTRTTRYIPAIGGGLSLEITDNTPTLAIADPLGTIHTTITIPTTGDATTPATGWTRTDEYGNNRDTAYMTTGAIAYQWHGAQERALDSTGLTLMGVRLYNAVTGLFTSRDPIAGGNTTTYTYPHDPVNSSDLDGKINWRAVGNWVYQNRVDIALTALAFVPGLGAVAWAIRIARVVRAARAAYYLNRTNAVIRASRPTAAIAGRIWSRTLRSVPSTYRNARVYGSTAARNYRTAHWSNSQRRWQSNFAYQNRGNHRYSNLHVQHRSRWW